MGAVSFIGEPQSSLKILVYIACCQVVVK